MKKCKNITFCHFFAFGGPCDVQKWVKVYKVYVSWKPCLYSLRRHQKKWFLSNWGRTRCNRSAQGLKMANCTSFKILTHIRWFIYMLIPIRVCGGIINGTILSLVDATTLIGLNIDEKLNWEKHINYVSNIISKKIGILYRIRHFVTRNTLIMLYNAFILPHITYGLEVWGAALK